MRPPLPLRLNEHILPDKSPKYEDLVARRRLGRTLLNSKPDHVGKRSATQTDNLGLFEYAHLRAPLPKDLTDSEIFCPPPTQPHTAPPETYFLMRRSKDGCINATGMFKIAFPWARNDDEKREREHVKSLSGCSRDETAGNIWVSPELALSLAEDYHMTSWIRALLDPADINPSSSQTASDTPIATPPRFTLPPLKPVTLEPPSLARTRSRRSTSPVKSYAMTPSKRRSKAKEAKEQKEASQQQLRELEASVAATAKEDGEKEKEKTEMNGAPVTPATTRKRATRKSTKKAQPVVESEQKDSPKEQNGQKEEASQNVGTPSELKERVNGSSKPASASKRRGAKKEVKEEATEQKGEPEQPEPTADEKEKSQDLKETVKQDTAEESKEANNEEQPPSSSQKENVKPYVFQTPKKPSTDSDEMPYSLAEMETPSRAETESLIARARQMVSAAAAAVSTDRLANSGSPLKNEVKASDEATSPKGEDEAGVSSAEKELASESTDSKKKRKADDFETEDKKIDALTKDEEKPDGNQEGSSDADRRPAKRTRLHIAQEIQRERVRHRGLVGLITVVGIAGIIPYFF